MKVKRKLLTTMGAVAMLVAASYNFYCSESEVKFSDLALENIEALAESELNHCEICYGFEMKIYTNCKVCELIGGDVVCDIHDQVPC